MRTFDQAKDSWQDLTTYSSLRDLKDAVRLEGKSSVVESGLRSASWKAFLLFENVDLQTWPKTLSSSRSAYNSFRSRFLQPPTNPSEFADPLSDEAESHWKAVRADEELRAEILQDVERCMPEIPYFQQPDTQRILLDILFVFCKLNPDVGYRQGMHELLAPVLWVVEHDSIRLGGESKILGEDKIIDVVFDAEHIEHDAFALFAQIMQSAKNFYEQTTHEGGQNPIVSRSDRIMNELLPLVDSELAQHLQRIDIVPQVFLIRWVRLLFGREFSFQETLSLWDAILAEDPSLQIVDYVCVAMLLRIRWQLLDSDYNTALTILLRYPQIADYEVNIPAQTFALDGLYLREHMTFEGGQFLIYKYTGRSANAGGVARPSTPPALQRNITTFSGQANAAARAMLAQRAQFSPPKIPRQVSNMEALLQSKARELYSKGGKAVRNAVDEVHKRAQEIRETQTPVPPASFYRHRAARSGSSSGKLLGRINELERRNKSLAKLLSGAVDELWEHQRKTAEMTGNEAVDASGSHAFGKSEVEDLSVAIAKVQFVQVYLQDSTLPLAEEDGSTDRKDGDVHLPEVGENQQKAGETKTNTDLRSSEKPDLESPLKIEQPSQDGALADPSTFDDIDEDPFELETEPRTTVPKVEKHRKYSLAKASLERNLLSKNAGSSNTAPTNSSQVAHMDGASSSTSLKDLDGTREPTSTEADIENDVTPPHKSDYRKTRGFLFGDSEDADTVVVSKRRGSGHKQKKKASKLGHVGTDNDIGALPRTESPGEATSGGNGGQKDDQS